MSEYTTYAKNALAATEGKHELRETQTYALLSIGYALTSISETLEAIAAWNTRAEYVERVRECEMYRDQYGVWHCKACESGADTDTGSDGTLDAWHDSWAPNYCPHCGAKVVDK